MCMTSVGSLLILSLALNSRFFAHALFPGAIPDEGDYRHLYPSACLAIQIDNHAHSLPYSLGLVENLRYPKDRMHVSFFASANVEKETLEIAQYWASAMKKLYLSAEVDAETENWREEALVWARGKRCGYALIATGDDFFMENVIRNLANRRHVVTTPLMSCPFDRFSNVEELLEESFISRTNRGSKRVYYSNGPYFIDLRQMDASYLTFKAGNIFTYDGPDDPIQVFAYSAYFMDIPIFVSNYDFYGYYLSSTIYSLEYHKQLLGYFLANLISDVGTMPFPHSSVLNPWYPEPSKLGFDEVYLINLKRRPERLEKMDQILRLLGIEYRLFEAVDGQALTEDTMKFIRFLPGYEDPYHKRPMKAGEIGCFLSHYGIWQDVVGRGYDRVLVFEDDVRFTYNGTSEIRATMEDLMKTHIDWDLIYLGRKKMTSEADEFYVQGHTYLSTVAYSYWTLGYILSGNGAQKLLDAKPLRNMLALDEFLPIMYNKHPNEEWSSYFEPRDLLAFTVYPLVVHPERYTYQEGYISDTEASAVIETYNTTKLLQQELTVDARVAIDVSTKTEL